MAVQSRFEDVQRWCSYNRRGQVIPVVNRPDAEEVTPSSGDCTWLDYLPGVTPSTALGVEREEQFIVLIDLSVHELIYANHVATSPSVIQRWQPESA